MDAGIEHCASCAWPIHRSPHDVDPTCRSCGAELPDPPARTYVTAIVRKAVTR